MNRAFVILWMIFFHIVDDYVLQAPCLSSLKQRFWWQNNAPEEKYKNDYIWALIMHSFSWAFMIMLPIAYFVSFDIHYGFVIMIAFNTAIHALTDHAKANWKLINLWQDQLIHMAQIFITAGLLFV